MQLSLDEILRYRRHLKIPELGAEGQLRLKKSSVLIVGAGGLGSPAALYLAAGGVGRLALVDYDVVELDNLQRQLLHWTEDVGRSKLESAAEKISRVNPGVELVRHEVRLSDNNAREIFSGYDLVVDGTDNLESRYIICEGCHSIGIPHIYGAVYRFEGRVSVFDGTRGPCYRCLHPGPSPPQSIPDCADAGVLGPLPGIIGSLQAVEAIKLIVGRGDSLLGRLLLLDALTMEIRILQVLKDPNCPVCGSRPSEGDTP